MSEPVEPTIYANDTVELSSTYTSSVSTDLVNNGEIHTRVMARDPAALYEITNVSMGSSEIFSSIDTDVFMEKLDDEYPEVIKNCHFVNSITAEGTAYDVQIKMNLDNGDSYVLVSGDILDDDLISTMNSWGVEMAPIPIFGSVTYYTDSTHTSTETVKMTSQNEVDSLAYPNGAGTDDPATWTTTIRGRTITNTDIQKVTLTDEVESIDRCFLYGCSSLIQLDLTQTTFNELPYGFLYHCSSFNQPLSLNNIETIGAGFMNHCVSFNQPLDLSSATSIGTGFMNYCETFNKPILLNQSLSTVNGYFMSMCYAFNQPLDLSAVTTIGNGFLYGCSSYNHQFNFSALESFGYDFLEQCISYNQPITFPSTVTSISGQFLDGCASFNSTITAPGVTEISNSVMIYCTSFNQPLSFLQNVTTIGSSFLSGCTAYNQAMNLSNVVTISDGFLAGCSSYNNSIVLSSTVTSIGDYFLYGCDQMVSTVNIGELNPSIVQHKDYCFATSNANAPCYTVGIAISGANNEAWADAFPNSSVDPYRRIIGPTFGTVTYYTNSLHTATNTVSIRGANEFAELCNSGTTWQADISGVQVDNNSILSVTLTEAVDDIPDYFLNNCTNLMALTTTSAPIQTIGKQFLSGCSSLNQAISLPYCTSVGTGFLENCTSFNSDLTVSALTTVDDNFMRGCTSFNKPLNLVAVYHFGDGFLMGCTAFNSAVTLGVDQTTLANPIEIVGQFMRGCITFNQPINTSAIYIFGDYFMSGCTRFNQALDLSIAHQINEYFLAGCFSFNQDLTLPSTLATFGAQALYNCYSMVSTIYVGNLAATITPEDDYTFAVNNSTAQACTTGIGISGTTAANWMTRLPNSEVGPYILHYKLASASSWTRESYATEADLETAARNLSTTLTDPFDVRMGMAEAPYRKLVNRTS